MMYQQDLISTSNNTRNQQMNVQQMVEQISTLGRRKNDPILVESILYYFGSIMLNKYKLRKTIGAKPYIRYYSIAFAPSSAGKSFMVDKIHKMCGLDNYSKIMHTNFNNKLSSLEDKPEGIDIVRRYIPKSVTIGLEGSKEALFNIIEAQAFSDFGSLNLLTEEFGEVITSSGELLSKLKEVYDTTYKTKLVKGSNETGGMKHDISNITCNLLALGSKRGLSTQAEEDLYRIATSGLYRRSFVIESDQHAEKTEQPDNVLDTELHIEKINEFFKQHAVNRVMKNNFMLEHDFGYDDNYIDYLEQIDDALLEDAAADRLDQFKQYSTGSLEAIIDCSHIICFLEGKLVVTSDHLASAYSFMQRTRQTVIDTFKPRLPYKVMYELLHKRNNLTTSEMIELEPSIPQAANKLKDQLALLDELCYRKDEVLIRNEGKVTRYAIEPLPETNINKLIVSVSNDGKMERAINYQPYEISWTDMKKICISPNIDSFCLSHFEESAQAPDGHRRKQSHISGQNLCGFDIDDGKITLKEMTELLSEYTYFIYTTKSHQVSKNGGPICDRYRVILPTKTEYHIDPEGHKQLYANIEEYLGIHNNDTATRNVSRLFFTNSSESVQTYSNTGDLFDISLHLPSTNKSDEFKHNFKEASQNVNFDNMSAREAGILKWFLMNTSEGSRYHNLTKLYYFYLDLGSCNPDEKVAAANRMLNVPMSENDMRNIYSIRK